MERKTMNDSMRKAENKYVQERRFYPVIDEFIDQADMAMERRFVKKTHIKAYILAASGGVSVYNCAACNVHGQIVRAAQELHTTPATVGLAFETYDTTGKRQTVLFEIMKSNVDEAERIARVLQLGEIARVRLACRAGIGMVALMPVLWEALAPRAVDHNGHFYMNSTLEQIKRTIVALDLALERESGNLARAAVATRYDGVATEYTRTFGQSVWQQSNRIIAAGHAPDM